MLPFAPDSRKFYMALCLSFPGCRHVQHPGMCLIKMLGAAAAQIAGKVNILMTVAV